MRKLTFGSPLKPDDIAWAIRSLQQIERASREDIETVFDGLTISGTYTDTRTLNASTATLPDLIAFVATMVSDIKKRGERKTGA